MASGIRQRGAILTVLGKGRKFANVGKKEKERKEELSTAKECHSNSRINLPARGRERRIVDWPRPQTSPPPEEKNTFGGETGETEARGRRRDSGAILKLHNFAEKKGGKATSRTRKGHTLLERIDSSDWEGKNALLSRTAGERVLLTCV